VASWHIALVRYQLSPTNSTFRERVASGELGQLTLNLDFGAATITGPVGITTVVGLDLDREQVRIIETRAGNSQSPS